MCALVIATPAASAKLVYDLDGIVIANDDGSNPFQVTTDRYDHNPALSPDARTVAFNRRDEGDDTIDLYLVDADGQDRRLLYDDADGFSLKPAFSPDHDQVVFERSTLAGHYWGDLYVIDTDGSDLRQLTATPYAEMDPVFSPDGNLIAYSDANNESTYSQLVTIKPDGSDRQEVTPDTGFYYDWEPSFSPDGDEIVFTRLTDEIYSEEIWKVNVDGTGLTQLTDLPGDWEFAQSPTWSPDGQTIVFYKEKGYGGEDCCELWAMNADGSDQHEIVGLGFTPSFQQPNATTIGGDIFDDLDATFELEPHGDYAVTISARDSVYGVARYELLLDAKDGQGFRVIDSVELDCSLGCPTEGPTEELKLDATEVPNGEGELKAQAIDGAGNPASKKKNTDKKFNAGITEPRIGRPPKGTNPNDLNPYPIYDPAFWGERVPGALADPRFTNLAPRYYRLLVPWERLEPQQDQIDWSADVGGGFAPDDLQHPLYKSTLDDQISRIRVLDPGVEIVAVFYHTPCWAIIPQAAMPGTSPCNENGYGRFPENNAASWPDVDWSNPRGGMIAQYKEFVKAFIEHYSGQLAPEAERIRLYTAWNEPNYFTQAQPQTCHQQKLDDQGQEIDPDFDEIECPPSSNDTGDMTADDYYYLLYRELYLQVKRAQSYDPHIKVLGGETADVTIGTPELDSNEATFTRSAIKRMKREGRCGPYKVGKETRKVLGAWSTHGYRGLRRADYKAITRLRRTLDGQNPRTGEPIPGFDTSDCTKKKQIWVTEVAAKYEEPGYRSEPEIETRTKDNECKLHDFLGGDDIAAIEDRKRVDVYMQYLFQTDWIRNPNWPGRDEPAGWGFDSGILSYRDASPHDDELDSRFTYDIFSDWAKYARKEGARPSRDWYRGEPHNCADFWSQ